MKSLFVIWVLIVLASNLALEVMTVSAVGGFWEFMQLSDLGVLVAQFGVNTVWATANIVMAVGTVLWFWVVSGR